LHSGKHLARNPKIEGSHPASGTGREKNDEGSLCRNGMLKKTNRSRVIKHLMGFAMIYFAITLGHFVAQNRLLFGLWKRSRLIAPSS
jgi:hypothetical protein